jgi:hypothetical protein
MPIVCVGVQRPCNVVVDGLLVFLRCEHAQQEVIAAQHGVAAGIEHGRIAHFHVRLARIDRQHRRLERSRVTHLGIAIAGSRGGATRRPSAIWRSRTSPSTPLAGS